MDPAHAVPDTGPPPRLVPCVGAVVLDPAGRLLLVRRGREPSRGLWSLPGGRVELGETAQAALAREVLEETGLHVTVGAAVGSLRIPAADGVVYDVADHRCTLLDTEERPTAGDDADDVVFADAGTLAALECTPMLRETLLDWGVLPL